MQTRDQNLKMATSSRMFFKMRFEILHRYGFQIFHYLTYHSDKAAIGGWLPISNVKPVSRKSVIS